MTDNTTTTDSHDDAWGDWRTRPIPPGARFRVGGKVPANVYLEWPDGRSERAGYLATASIARLFAAAANTVLHTADDPTELCDEDTIAAAIADVGRIAAAADIEYHRRTAEAAAADLDGEFPALAAHRRTETATLATAARIAENGHSEPVDIDETRAEAHHNHARATSLFDQLAAVIAELDHIETQSGITINLEAMADFDTLPAAAQRGLYRLHDLRLQFDQLTDHDKFFTVMRAVEAAAGSRDA